MDKHAHPHNNRDQDIAIKMYIAVLIAFVLTLIPTLTFSIVSTFLLLALLVAAYSIRWRVHNGGLAHHHMNYIIRTAWIGGFYALILTGVSSAYMIATIDYTPVEPCAMHFVDAAMDKSDDEIIEMIQPCLDDFISVNQKILIITALIIAVPSLLFFFVRYGRGYWIVRQGEFIHNPKRWF